MGLRFISINVSLKLAYDQKYYPKRCSKTSFFTFLKAFNKHLFKAVEINDEVCSWLRSGT